MLAAALVIKNIGGAKDDPRFVRKVMQRTTHEMFAEAVNRDPQLKQQLNERLAQVKEQNKKLSPNKLKATVDEAAAAFERETVEKNIPQDKFIERVVTNAPKALYTTPWKYAKYHRGVEIRIRTITHSIPAELKTNPKAF